MLSGKKDTFTINDIAKLCGVSGEAVRQWCRDGRLKSTYDGYRYAIKKSDLLDHILRNPKHEEFLLATEPKGMMQKAIREEILSNLRKLRRRN